MPKLTRNDEMREQDERIVALMREGLTDHQIKKAVGGKSEERLLRLRQQYGLPEPDRKRRWKGLMVEKEHRDTLREVVTHLGHAWVAQALGRETGYLDEHQIVRLLRIHAALRLELLDASSELAAVRLRLRQQRRERLIDLATGVRHES